MGGSAALAKGLYARHGWKRLEVLNANAFRSAQEGRSMGQEATEHRQLGEAAARCRAVARGARARLSEADGTDARARREYAGHGRATF